ncbi:putative membrane protein, partial [Yersinia pestis PY-101]
MRLATA